MEGPILRKRKSTTRSGISGKGFGKDKNTSFVVTLNKADTDTSLLKSKVISEMPNLFGKTLAKGKTEIARNLEGLECSQSAQENTESIDPPGKPLPQAWLSNVWKGVGEPHFTCEVCHEKFEKKMEFTKHLFNHRMEEQKNLELTCQDCCVMFHNVDVLKDHMKRSGHGCGQMVGNGWEEIKRFGCKECPSTFKEKSQYQKHMEVHQGPLVYCKACNRAFSHKIDLKEHVKYEHRNVDNDRKVCLAVRKK